MDTGPEQPPPAGTVQRWAWDFIGARSLSLKLHPPPPPPDWDPQPRRYLIDRPGRPPELAPRAERIKTPRPGALVDPRKRALVLHTFLHHELQAAELFAWAILAFPQAHPAFQRGLLGILQDELRHMHMYAEHLERLGHGYGSFAVNDWFWARVPSAPTVRHFVAGLGMGFEGGNLDHGLRFAERFRAAGDERAARIQEQIVEEEVPHVAFALHWFRAGDAEAGFEEWRCLLPEPLSPAMMRGTPLNLEARRRAGYSAEFLRALAAWGTVDGRR